MGMLVAKKYGSLSFYFPSIPPLTLYFKFLTANFVSVVLTALLTI
jgi:hypothetical protein